MNIVQITGPGRSTPADAGLNLIDDQEDAALPAYALDARVVVSFKYAMAVWSLHDLNEKSRDLAGTGCVEIRFQSMDSGCTTVRPLA